MRYEFHLPKTRFNRWLALLQFCPDRDGLFMKNAMYGGIRRFEVMTYNYNERYIWRMRVLLRFFRLHFTQPMSSGKPFVNNGIRN